MSSSTRMYKGLCKHEWELRTGDNNMGCSHDSTLELTWEEAEAWVEAHYSDWDVDWWSEYGCGMSKYVHDEYYLNASLVADTTTHEWEIDRVGHDLHIVLLNLKNLNVRYLRSQELWREYYVKLGYLLGKGAPTDGEWWEQFKVDSEVLGYVPGHSFR